jgi:glucose/arabinose dehydrogenase
LWAWTEASRTNQLIGFLSVVTTGQRGLYAFAFDPGFLTNGHLYVFRSPMLAVGNSNRLSQFTARADGTSWRIEPGTEKVLLDIPSVSHGHGQGGGLLVDPRDGLIYLGVGDNSVPAETPEFYDDPQHAAQDPARLWGKVLRLEVSGDVPPDNPFAKQAGWRPEVYARGFRNPFSFACDVVRGRIYVGDIGFDRREDREEINLLEAGGNYGWPRCDGRHRDTMTGAACPLEGALAPWHTYPHGSAAAVVLGPFISGGTPPGWPVDLTNGLVYGDFVRRHLQFAQVDEARHAVTNVLSLASGLAGGALSMTLASHGELYFVEYAGWRNAHPADRLSRLVPRRQLAWPGAAVTAEPR